MWEGRVCIYGTPEVFNNFPTLPKLRSDKYIFSHFTLRDTGIHDTQKGELDKQREGNIQRERLELKN